MQYKVYLNIARINDTHSSMMGLTKTLSLAMTLPTMMKMHDVNNVRSKFSSILLKEEQHFFVMETKK